MSPENYLTLYIKSNCFKNTLSVLYYVFGDLPCNLGAFESKCIKHTPRVLRAKETRQKLLAAEVS